MSKTKKRQSPTTHRLNQDEGFKLVREWRASGLSVQKFCDARGIGAHRIWYWKDRLASFEDESKESPFIVLSGNELEIPPSFHTANGDAIEVLVDGRHTVRIPSGAADLAEILCALHEVEP